MKTDFFLAFNEMVEEKQLSREVLNAPHVHPLSGSGITAIISVPEMHFGKYMFCPALTS